jgi:hypothetical protein
VIGPNEFAGNKTADLNDLGTDTQYDLPPDTQAPSVPTGVVAVAQSLFQVQVTWDASTDDVGVDGYTVYRDGSPIATVGGSKLAFLDETVAAGTTYQVSGRCVRRGRQRLRALDTRRRGDDTGGIGVDHAEPGRRRIRRFALYDPQLRVVVGVSDRRFAGTPI